MNYVMRNLENSLKNNEEFIEKGFDAVKDNKTWMESIKEDAKKIGEDAANTLLNKGGNIVISDLLAASLEPLSQKIDEAREKSKESMLKSMKEVKKFREEIEAMEKEAPIEYGTYEVEVKEAPPMFGERENALARDRFNSDEEYLNALTAALEEKEAIIADNDKLKAEMEADLARLEQKANKHHEIEYTIGQRYEEIDHKYSYINDYDSSKKFKELIDLDRAFSNVPYVLGNNNKIRENERKMKERDANRALLTEEIEKLKAENKKYIEDFDKKAAYVENNIKTKGGFVGMPSTKIVGKKCTMQEINDMAYFRNHLEEYVESAQNMKKLLEDEQKKRIKNYTDNPLIKKGPQIINSLGFYSKEKEIRTNYKEFLTLVLDAIDKEKEEPGAFDKLINSDSFTVKGLISDSKVEITDTMRVIARNARDFEEVRDVIAKKGTLDNLVDNEFVTLQDDLTGDDGLNYLGTLLDNSIRDAKEKIIKRLGDKLDAEIDEMRKYIVSVNDYFNAAVGKEMKAYDQTQNAINMEKQHEQQLYKDLLDKASLDRQYALAYDDIDKKLTEGIDETSKNLKEETLAIKKEIENVKLNMAKAQLIKDVDDAYNIAKGKEPFVIGLDRVNFGKSYSDSGAPLSEGLSRESLLTNMVGDTSASSQKIIDSVYINGITAREYYKGAHSGENLTDDQIKEELGKDMMLLANNAYGIDIKNRSQLEGNVISVKEDGVMRIDQLVALVEVALCVLSYLITSLPRILITLRLPLSHLNQANGSRARKNTKTS